MEGNIVWSSPAQTRGVTHKDYTDLVHVPICSCSHACTHVASSNPHLAVACTFWVHIHSGKVVGPVSIGHDAWHIDQLLTDAVMKGILQCINSQQSLGTVPAGSGLQSYSTRAAHTAGCLWCT